jgi:hypothetical protein
MKKITLLLLMLFLFTNCVNNQNKIHTVAANKHFEELHNQILKNNSLGEQVPFQSIDIVKQKMDSLIEVRPLLAETYILEQIMLYKRIKDSIEKIENPSVTREEIQNIKTPITNEAFESILSNWDGSLPSLVSLTKQSLNDPDSFKHVETGYVIQDDYVRVRMIYRAKNSYNAIIKSSITANVDRYGNIINVISIQ